MKLKKFLILAVMFALTSTHSWARKPAVLPVTGLSIEGHKTPKNPKAFGFNFDRGVPRAAVVGGEPVEPAITDETIKALVVVGGVFALIAPGIYVSFFRRRKEQDGVTTAPVVSHDNVTSISSVKKNDRSENKDDRNLPKAS